METEMATGWTVETLKEYFDARINAMEKAVDKSEINIAEWRKGSNEWRQAMDDREIKFLPRTEYKPSHDALVDRLSNLEIRVTRNEGRGAGLNAGWGYLVAGVGFLLTLVVLYATLRKG